MKVISRPTIHCEPRPPATQVDTIVVHSMRCPWSTKRHLARCIKILNLYRASAHFIITRSGTIVQLVSPYRKAWHAGPSRMPFPNDSRESVNTFSIGIELLEVPGRPFTSRQYRALAKLIRKLMKKFPLKDIVGHEHIAPSRKQDPGALFNWATLKKLLSSSSLQFPPKL